MPEIVPTHVHGPNAKLALFVPLIAILETVTAVVLVLVRYTHVGNPAEFRATAPNWIGLGDTVTAASARVPLKAMQMEASATQSVRFIR